MAKFFFWTKAKVEKFFVAPKVKQKSVLPSLRMIFFIFGIFYAWPEENMDKANLRWYRFKGVLFRMFFIYLSTATQVAYIFTVTTREELFEGLFILLTQLVLILKMEFFYKNVFYIQKLVRRLDGELYQPRSAEEDFPLEWARKKTTIFWILYLIFSDGLVTKWLIISCIYTTVLVPAWPVVDHTTPYAVFLLVLVYQYVGIFLNASFNISWDSLVAALLALTTAHLNRLQIQLMKVGHKDVKDQKEDQRITMVATIYDNNDSRNEVYKELLRCIVFHQEVTGFLRDVLKLFSGPMLAQLYCSVFILCITEFRLITDVNTTTETIRALTYLICLIIQVVQYCYFGNEINYMSQTIHQATAFMNYPAMNIKTRKLLIAFQQLTAKGIHCCAKKIFTIELSMATFVTIIKTSYSYLAVLRSMTD
ncbi:odorant receptor Or1-like [Anopheles maculipalpis]|uniref:odorant receptor Or1-like n=1 Tax=Anopheles maculipalpis TaxID=1496333 RepID=UPI0021592714|nr:odorant receptor Or1-like [Anopheles maculipalpis]